MTTDLGLVSALAQGLAKGAIPSLLGSAVSKKGTRVTLDASGSPEALSRHAAYVASWASRVTFKDLRRDKALPDIFVDLKLSFLRHSDADDTEELSVIELLKTPNHRVILGDPGAGKSTSLQYLAHSVLPTPDAPAFPLFPIVVRLRDFSPDDRLLDRLCADLGLRLDHTGPLDRSFSDRFRIDAITTYLDRLPGLLLIDGLDETHPDARESIIRDIRTLIAGTSRGIILVTCRTGEFPYNLEGAGIVVIRPLDESQVDFVAHHWLPPRKASAFLHSIRETPYAGAEVRPLTLAHLLAIFERTGRIPEKPKTVYRKIIQLLLEDWDEQRSVRRVSRYAAFDVYAKEEFLRALAHWLTSHGYRGQFSHAQLSQAYRAIYAQFGLPQAQHERVAREIESHTGLIIQSSRDEYEFAHKALQEYLTAEHMLRAPMLPPTSLVRLPAEAALLVALSPDAGGRTISIIKTLNRASASEIATFGPPFLRRLLLERPTFAHTRDLVFAFLYLAHRAHLFQIEDELEPMDDYEPGYSRPDSFSREMADSMLSLFAASPGLAQCASAPLSALSIPSIDPTTAVIPLHELKVSECPSWILTGVARPREGLLIDRALLAHLGVRAG